jgi:hypothetical protein
MLERLQDAPDQVIGLSASGTVIAWDIEDAIRLLGSPGGSTPAGLVVVVARDFDGYFAEIARGLADASRAHKSLARLAVVTEADRLDEARLSGLDDSPVPLFATAERKAALDWAAARR